MNARGRVRAPAVGAHERGACDPATRGIGHIDLVVGRKDLAPDGLVLKKLNNKR